MIYKLVVFLHVISVLGFLLAHGVSASISYALKRERDTTKIRALLDLSAASYPMMLWTLLATVVFGLIAAFLVNTWWRFGWIWVSIALLVVIVVLMAVFGANVFSEARKAAGLPYMVKGKPQPAEDAKSDEEVHSVLVKINPTLLLIIGYGGYAVIAWLMTAKPF
jgi:cell division protein FtsW (lipid II flippase)